MKEYKIGDLIDVRSDGSYIYMSNRGILNLDNSRELDEAIAEDKAYLEHYCQ